MSGRFAVHCQKIRRILFLTFTQFCIILRCRIAEFLWAFCRDFHPYLRRVTGFFRADNSSIVFRNIPSQTSNSLPLLILILFKLHRLRSCITTPTFSVKQFVFGNEAVTNHFCSIIHYVFCVVFPIRFYSVY